MWYGWHCESLPATNTANHLHQLTWCQTKAVPKQLISQQFALQMLKTNQRLMRLSQQQNVYLPNGSKDRNPSELVTGNQKTPLMN